MGDEDRPELPAGVGAVPRLSVLGSDQVATLEAEQFRGLAKDWAAYCLDNYTGGLLKQGMEVAAALAEFATELERTNG